MLKKIIIVSGVLGVAYFLYTKYNKSQQPIELTLDKIDSDALNADDIYDQKTKERETRIAKRKVDLQKQDFSRFGSYAGYARHSILQAEMRRY